MDAYTQKAERMCMRGLVWVLKLWSFGLEAYAAALLTVTMGHGVVPWLAHADPRRQVASTRQLLRSYGRMTPRAMAGILLVLLACYPGDLASWPHLSDCFRVHITPGDKMCCSRSAEHVRGRMAYEVSRASCWLAS